MKKLILSVAAIALVAVPTASARVVGNVGGGLAGAQSVQAASTALSLVFNGHASDGAGCASLGAGCAKVRGGVAGNPLSHAAVRATFTADWAHAANGCAPAGGEVHLSDSVGNSLTLNVTGTACRTASGYAFDGSYTVNAGGGAYANTGVGTGAAKFTVTGQSMHGVFAGSFDPAQERAEDGMPE